MPSEYHGGVWVNSEEPVPGVVNSNAVPGIDDEMQGGEWLYPKPDQLTDDNGELVFDEDGEPVFGELPDHVEANEVLIGGWMKGANGEWVPDRSSEYSAVVDINYYYTATVVWSRYTKRCALCSPVAPGQASLNEEGEYLAYDFPPDMWTRSW